MKVVILCGGFGTRIRESSESLPKPMLPIGGKPIIWHIMKIYAAQGFNEFILCLGYKGWLIKEFFINYRAMTSDITVNLGADTSIHVHGKAAPEDWKVSLIETGEDTMTGGRVAAIRHLVEGEREFMLTYGDGVADLALANVLTFHREHGKAATVTAVRPPGRFGEMRLDGNRVTEFNEKPQASEGYINGGFFVLDALAVWKYLDGGPAEVLEREPLRRMSRDDQLRGYRHDGFWQPMDTHREYLMLNELWASGHAPWKIWT